MNQERPVIVTGAGPVGPAARRLPEAPIENYPGGWGPPRETRLPTGSELVTDYLEPRAAHPALAPHISIGHRVTTATRIQDDGKGVDRTHSVDRGKPPFLDRTGTAGNTTDIVARVVIDAPGTWHTPNPADRSGSEAISEAEARAQRVIISPLPDPLRAGQERFAEKTIPVLDAGHFAANTLLSLGRLRQGHPETTILWGL